MKIGIAQIKPVKGDISANIDKHRILVEMALASKSTAIFFPELSLTGYEPELAGSLATTKDDTRLGLFQKLSDSKLIAIGLGIPEKTKTGVCISMVIFQPHKPRQTYAKQQLHSDELPFFEKGNVQLILSVDGKKIAPAICYESLQQNHADTAKHLGSDIYLASVAKSQKGVDKAMAYFPEVAGKYSMTVLMSNCVGYCDNFLSAGQSAIWTKQGKLAGQFGDKEEGILIFDTESEDVMMRTI